MVDPARIIDKQALLNITDELMRNKNFSNNCYDLLSKQVKPVIEQAKQNNQKQVEIAHLGLDNCIEEEQAGYFVVNKKLGSSFAKYLRPALIDLDIFDAQEWIKREPVGFKVMVNEALLEFLNVSAVYKCCERISEQGYSYKLSKTATKYGKAFEGWSAIFEW